MKYYNVKISIHYRVEAENEEDAIHQADIEFYEDTCPSYDIEIEESEEEEVV